MNNNYNIQEVPGGVPVKMWTRGVPVDQAVAQVDRLTPDLASAEYDLERTTVTAPSDGYVIQMMARPGLMAVPMPLRPLYPLIRSTLRSLP